MYRVVERKQGNKYGKTKKHVKNRTSFEVFCSTFYTASTPKNTCTSYCIKFKINKYGEMTVLFPLRV